MMIRSLSVAVSMVAISVMGSGCGSKFGLSPHASHAGSSSSGSSTSSQPTVSVPVDVNVSTASLALADTTVSFSGSVTGCLSGESKTFSQTTSTITLVQGDTSCSAQLASLSVAFADSGTPVTYTVDPSSNFSAGNQFVINPSSGSRLMILKVVSQLPSPIATGASIAFAVTFEESSATAAATISGISAGVSLSVANPVLYDISKLTAAVAGNGGGAFAVTVNCLAAVAADGKCDGLAQSGFVGAIGVDTYLTGGSPRNLTLAECTALATGTGSVAPASTYLQTDDNASAPNGGALFNVTGPATLCAAANANLVIAVTPSGGAGSCKYWRTSVSCP